MKKDKLFTQFRVCSIIIILIFTVVISFVAFYFGCGISFFAFNKSSVDEVDVLTPYDNHGLGRERMCEISTDYAETMSSDAGDDKSSPFFSPLIKGTVDYISGDVSFSNDDYYVLRSGRIVKQENCEIVENGYTMPSNSISVSESYTSEDTYIILNTDWKVPFNSELKNQDYYKGYLLRQYNVSSFTSSYIDFVFYYTESGSGKFNFNESSIIKDAEWISSDNGTVTLRLYFRNQGIFYGYSAYYTNDNRLVLSFKSAPENLNGCVVELDAGHGGKDCGAIGVNGIYESGINLNIAVMVRSNLQNHGVKVIMTRSDDTFYKVSARQSMARNSDADLFVSIHNNFSVQSSSLSGPEAYYYRANSYLPAKLIFQRLSSAWSNIYFDNQDMKQNVVQEDGGIRFYPYMVTRVEECPSVLIECGYLSNNIECEKLSDKSTQQVIADYLSYGILDYLNEITSR